MANNEVKFSLKIEDNVTGTIKDASASTKNFGRVVKNVTREVNRRSPAGRRTVCTRCPARRGARV